MADPDFEVVVDPRTGEQPGNPFLRRVLSEIVGDARRPDQRIAPEAAVEGIEKLLAAVMVIFPGVLAVEDDGDEIAPPVLGKANADIVKMESKISHRVLDPPAVIDKTDLVRNKMVAEDHGNRLPVMLDQIGRSEERRVGKER